MRIGWSRRTLFPPRQRIARTPSKAFFPLPTWSEILGELRASQQDGVIDFDGVRRRHLRRLHDHTQRDIILYASGWLQTDDAPAVSTSIVDEDIHGLMEVSAGLKGSKLDLILHSPGGSTDAAEAVVSYLRSRYTDIRVLVPQLAMSAATMIACAADTVVMGKHSFLGPTDPQFLLWTPLGPRTVPAQAVLDQFDKAQRECADPTKLAAWLPMLSQFGPDLLERCETALKLSQELVCQWLESHMFAGQSDGPKKAQRIAKWLADHKHFKSHSRHLPRTKLIEHGMEITELEGDEELQDRTLSVFHATTHTLAATHAVKIVENHQGRAFIKPHIPRPPPAEGGLGIEQMAGPTP